MGRFSKTWLRRASVLFVVALAAVLTFSGCQGPTNIDTGGEGGRYSVELKTDPLTLNPPQLATLSFQFIDTQTKKVVSELEPVSGALIHNIVIRSDLGYFRHSVAQTSLREATSLLTYFPTVGEYYTYNLYKPAGGEAQVFTATIATGRGEQEPELVFDTNQTRSSGGLKVQMLMGNDQIKANEPVQFAFFVTELGRPVTGLWPLYDAPAHLWLVDEHGGNFTHLIGASSSRRLLAEATPAAGQTAQPTQPIMAAPTIEPGLSGPLATATSRPVSNIAPVQQTAQAPRMRTPDVQPDVGYGPEVLFTHTFPHEGPYKMWLELKHEELTLQFDFSVRVVK